MAWVAVAVGGASLISGLVGAKEQGDAQDRALARADAAGLADATVTGSGGASAFSRGGGGVGFNLGNLAQPQSSSARLSGQASQLGLSALINGIPRELLEASQALDSQSLDLESFARGGAGAERLAGLSLRDAFDPARTSDAVSSRALRTLREQAAPQEAAALQSFRQSLFGSGRGAVTGAEGNESSIGGGRLAAAFAQGLSRADLDRQLQAQDFGIRAAQSEENLLASAFNRFGSTAGLASDFNTARFSRVSGALQDRFQRQVGMTTLPADIAAAFQGVANRGTEGALNIGNFGINLAQLGLQQNTARSNAAAGVASNVGSLVSSPNFSASPMADSFGALTSGATDAAITGLGNRFPNAPIVGSGTKPNPLNFVPPSDLSVS